MVELPELPQGHFGDLQQMIVGEDQVLQAPGQRRDTVRHQGGNPCKPKEIIVKGTVSRVVCIRVAFPTNQKRSLLKGLSHEMFASWWQSLPAKRNHC